MYSLSERIILVIIAIAIGVGTVFFAYSWEKAIEKMFNNVSVQVIQERR